MVYQGDQGGRVAGDGSNGGSFWTYVDVQQDLVEAFVLWLRSPGEGRWPYAGDGPWHLYRYGRDDHGAHEPKSLRRLPLTRDEVQWRDQISEWLVLVPDADRQLVVLALTELAGGAKRVSWSKIRTRLDAEISPRGLGQRYSKAIAGVVAVLIQRREPRPWAAERGSGEGLAEAVTNAEGRPGAHYATGERAAQFEAGRLARRAQRR